MHVEIGEYIFVIFNEQGKTHFPAGLPDYQYSHNTALPRHRDHAIFCHASVSVSPHENYRLLSCALNILCIGHHMPGRGLNIDFQAYFQTCHSFDRLHHKWKYHTHVIK